MNKIGKKQYFNLLLTISITALNVLLILGQLTFFVLAFSFGAKQMKMEDIFIIGFGFFGIPIAICLMLFFAGAFRCWIIDEEGVTNRGLLYKRKIIFSKMTKFEKKREQIESFFRINVHDCYFFYENKKYVIVPVDCLTEYEKEWLKSKISEFGNN